jgi:hypothetical protein
MSHDTYFQKNLQATMQIYSCLSLNPLQKMSSLRGENGEGIMSRGDFFWGGFRLWGFWQRGDNGEGKLAEGIIREKDFQSCF